MITLTTRERDILKIILNTNRPVDSAELAELLNLTPRQVNYSMRGVRGWLKQHNQKLQAAPGLGFAANMLPEQAQLLAQKIARHSEVQIVLSLSQRQQLLALFLLTKLEPVILSQLEQLAQASRMTLVKDLNEIEGWLKNQRVSLIRKTNFGIQVTGPESACQSAIIKLLWGESSLSDAPLVELTHHNGLTFKLQADAALLPLVAHVGKTLNRITVRRAINVVAQADGQLGGRFSDDAILHLAVVIAVQHFRIQERKHREAQPSELEWLHQTQVWPIAAQVAQRLARDAHSVWMPADIASMAREMLAAPRNEVSLDELKILDGFAVVLEQLLSHISHAFHLPALKVDQTLHNGLSSNLLPAYFRQRFQLWFPPALNCASLPEACERESAIAREVAEIFQAHWHFELPANEINNLIVLLRAAYIRHRTNKVEHVIVVCPSGMATAQLLMARVRARFPHFNILEVVSLRDLTSIRAASADLILTTIPLPKPFAKHPKAIQVHPLLTAADIEAITQFLS
jgi:mannitol operon transcriptional antiterminator